MIDIRPFEVGDKAALSQIYFKCRLDTFHWVPREEFRIEDFEKDTDGEVILVAIHDSTPIGFASVWKQDNFLHHLYVDPEHQNRGVGKRLLNEALNRIGRPARLKCVVKNSKACQFYEMNNWNIESTTHEGPMGSYHTYMLT